MLRTTSRNDKNFFKDLNSLAYISTKTYNVGSNKSTVMALHVLFGSKMSNLVYNLNRNFLNKKHVHTCKQSPYYLELIFMRNRFFPQLFTTLTGKTIFNVTLGIISNYFSKKKNFLRSKASYLMLATYIRRVLVGMSLLNLNLSIRGVPIHLNSILKHILSSSNVIYKNPFKDTAFVNEIEGSQSFTVHFSYVMFTSSKGFGLMKSKKKGRLKRKIAKRVISNNNILD